MFALITMAVLSAAPSVAVKSGSRVAVTEARHAQSVKSFQAALIASGCAVDLDAKNVVTVSTALGLSEIVVKARLTDASGGVLEKQWEEPTAASADTAEATAFATSVYETLRAQQPVLVPTPVVTEPVVTPEPKPKAFPVAPVILGASTVVLVGLSVLGLVLGDAVEHRALEGGKYLFNYAYADETKRNQANGMYNLFLGSGIAALVALVGTGVTTGLFLMEPAP